MVEYRMCTICERDLPATIEYFHKQRDGKNGLKSECKECEKIRDKLRYDNKKSRSWHYKRTYGIILEDYNVMFNKFNGCCWICGKHQTEFKQRLSVDHDHDTGRVRGLLCQGCNTKVGAIDEYIKNPDKWDKYLKGDLL